jgi:Xaa-Pro dipeptidase
MYHSNIFTPSSEIEKRIQKLQHHLKANHIEAALILQKTDLFYFTGTIQQAHLYVPADGEPVLMVRKDLRRAEAESAIGRVLFLESPGRIPELLTRNGYTLPAILGLEYDVLPVNLFLNLRQIFDNPETIDISNPIRLIRSQKTPYEIEIIRESAKLSDQVAAYMQEVLREGLTEIELAGIIEARARKLGHQGFVRMRLWGNEMFYGHLMSGPAAAVSSYMASPTGGAGINPAVSQGAGSRRIKRHEPILLDYVFAHRGYLSDHTRIFAIGEISDELMHAHEAMLGIQDLLKKETRPGVRAGEIYDLALRRTTELGYESNFMGSGSQSVQFVGHGIGLEVDEYPFLGKNQTLELKKGMAIALEPKLVFPGKGVVGIENMHIVTEDGLEQLTLFPEEIILL